MIFKPDLWRQDFLALLVSACLAACGQQVADTPPIERAKAYLEQDNPQDARIQLERALDEGARRRDVAALLGEAALGAGDLDAAERWLRSAEFSDETAVLGYRMLGRLEMARGRLREAGQAFDRALAVDPHDAHTWVDIGRLRYTGGEQEEAIESAEHALALSPDDPSALLFRGQLLRDARGPGASLSWFADALSRNPSDRELRLEYAASLGDAGEAVAMLDTLRAGGDKIVQSPRGLFLQAALAARGGQFLLARELLQASGLDADGQPAAVLLSGIIDLQNQNFASAAQTFDRLLARQPDNQSLGELLALALSRSDGERELVNRFAERAAGPAGSPYLRTLVGRAYEALDQRAQAAVFLNRAALAPEGLAILPASAPETSLSPVSGEQVRDFVRRAITRGRAPDALAKAREFARRNPGSGDAEGFLGDAELAAGNLVAARRSYARAASIRRPWALVLRQAASAADGASAVAILEGYLQADPLNGQAAAFLADAYAQEGRWEKASILFDHAMQLGQDRTPWVLAARSVAARQRGDEDLAFSLAATAHQLQPFNPRAIAALIAALPESEAVARADLAAKLRSLRRR